MNNSDEIFSSHESFQMTNFAWFIMKSQMIYPLNNLISQSKIN